MITHVKNSHDIHADQGCETILSFSGNSLVILLVLRPSKSLVMVYIVSFPYTSFTWLQTSVHYSQVIILYISRLCLICVCEYGQFIFFQMRKY